MSDLLPETTSTAFATDVLESDIPVLVDFWAPWCGPCIALAPKLEALAAQFAGSLRIVKLNIDEHPEISTRFAVRSIPTLVAFRQGEIAATLTGPSISRLRVLAEDLAGAPPSPLQSTPLAQVATRLPVSSFAGDVAVKAAALHRLAEDVIPRRVKPSDVIGGEKGQFQASLGLPEGLGQLIDLLFQTVAKDKDEQPDRAPIIRLFEAIPVGADLRSVLPATVHWLVYDAQWGVGRHLQDEVGKALFARMTALHDKDLSADTDADAQALASWQRLARDVVSYVDASRRALGDSPDDRAQPGRAPLLLDLFEKLTLPLGQMDLMGLPMNVVQLALHDYEAFPGWSDEEEGKVKAINRTLLDEAVASLGRPQKGEPEATEAWFREYRERNRQAKAVLRAEEPEFWARYDACGVHRQVVMARFNEALIDRVILLLLRAPRIEIKQ